MVWGSLPRDGVPEVEPAEGGKGPQGSRTSTFYWTDVGTKALGGCRDSQGKPEASLCPLQSWLPSTVLLALTPAFPHTLSADNDVGTDSLSGLVSRFNNAKMVAFCRISC